MIKILLILTVISAWSGILTGYYTTYLDYKNQSLLLGFWQLHSYFTYWTNILVAAAASVLLCVPSSRLAQFILKPDVFAAIAFYIVSVGIGNYILFPFKPLVDLYAVSDILVHGVTPALFLGYWLVCADKRYIQLSKLHYWLIYPWCYVIYTTSHIAWSGFSPYPFTNLSLLGWSGYAVNFVIATLAVVTSSFLFVKLVNVCVSKGTQASQSC